MLRGTLQGGGGEGGLDCRVARLVALHAWIAGTPTWAEPNEGCFFSLVPSGVCGVVGDPIKLSPPPISPAGGSAMSWVGRDGRIIKRRKTLVENRPG